MSKKVDFFIALFLFSILLFIPLMLDSKNASAQDVQAEWDAVIEMSPDQVVYAQSNFVKPSNVPGAKGVARSIAARNLVLSGVQGIDQLRTILFDELSPAVDFLGGPVELTLVLPAGNAPITLQLEARLTAGYSWQVVSDSQARYIQNGEAAFVTRYRGLGAPSLQTIQLMPRATGDETVRLVYRRQFDQTIPTHARLSLKVPETSTVVELNDPTPSEPVDSAATTSVSTDNKINPIAVLPLRGLPTSWDWRTQGIVPAVRDQGSCGSCWAFGTVAVMESAVMKAGAPSADLSEQFLLSCNKDGWSCNGGLTASKYHLDTLGKSQTEIGAVLESVKPYTATNGSCSIALPHAYKADSWQFIVANEFTMPTVDQIKNAIYTYGPVTAGVCAGSGWNSYSGGTFAIDESSQCGGSTNHQIVLVGWDDATGTWILRNSWGSAWGNAGYMNIKWGISKVGEGTSWIKYVGTSPLPTSTLLPTLPPTLPRTPTIAPTSTAKQTSTRTPTLPAPTFTRTPIVLFTSTRTPTRTSTPVVPPTSITLPTATRTATRTVTPLPTISPTFTRTALPTFTRTPTLLPSNVVPAAYSPSGDTYAASPTYSWERLGTVSSYMLRVKDLASGTYLIDGLVVASTSCNTATNRCSNTPVIMLTFNKNYQWQVAAGSGAYSAPKTFTPLAGFNSQFNGSAAGWVVRPGGAWANSATSLYTNGAANLVSSASYDQIFSNFTFQVRMKRVSPAGYSSGLVVRGIPNFGIDKDWKTSYQFLYRQNGTFSVWKGINGSWTPLKDWTASPSIVTNGWNTLKVIADGKDFRYYINEILVWSGSDISLVNGQVGLWMYRGSSAENLEVDWAVLGMSELFKAAERVEIGQIELNRKYDRFGKPLR